MTVKLHIWGDYACFTRPEMKAERVSYDVLTPSAARGVLEAINWKPAIRWVIDRIHVLKPIKFQTLRRNEVASRTPYGGNTGALAAMTKNDGAALRLHVEENRQQRATLALTKVGYVIEAHFERTAKWGPDDSEGKHADMFRRRARKGQCFHRPCLGLREFAADFELVEDRMPDSEMTSESRDLGFMLHDIDYQTRQPRFFRARMENGVIEVPPMGEVA